jgi:hypothetical protein
MSYVIYTKEADGKTIKVEAEYKKEVKELYNFAKRK